MVSLWKCCITNLYTRLFFLKALYDWLNKMIKIYILTNEQVVLMGLTFNLSLNYKPYMVWCQMTNVWLFSSIRNRVPHFSWFLLFHNFLVLIKKVSSFSAFIFAAHILLLSQISHYFMSCAFPLWNDLSQLRYILQISPQVPVTSSTSAVWDVHEWIVNWYGYF